MRKRTAGRRTNPATVVLSPDRRLTSEGAEFLALGQLLIRGIPTYKSYTNQRGFDLVAISPISNKFARIQIKSRQITEAKRFLISKTGIENCDFVILVKLKAGFTYVGSTKKVVPFEEPEFYIIDKKSALKFCDNKPTFPSIIIKEKEFEPYRQGWNRIQRFLHVRPTSFGAKQYAQPRRMKQK
jgi:hypothetical protein